MFVFNLNSSRLVNYIMPFLSGYNHNKYWKRRSRVINPDSKVPLIIKLFYLWYIKRVDSKKLCSFGTNINSGSFFASPPNLPHGPNGIIIGHDLSFGYNVTIFQQVTVMHGGGRIGNNVMIGAGAKILPGVNIGDNAKIGANAIVVEDIPANSTCVCQKPRIILH